ncbi:terpenoid synthase [Collybia nuda]|uniref:Terpene synthase n=1 Tax=Collybia nuda TaxID=64659 RepID=A0A9P6CCA4_9AGAR|nr:terpenoid synthase [Collybia nuda]
MALITSLKSTERTTFVLPDLLANWPFNPEPNPCQDIVAQSAAWVESFKPFDAKAQNAFNRCKFGIFASLAYPHATGAHFRVACDLMNLFFVFDEYSDCADGEAVGKQAADIMNALRYPDTIPPEGDSLLGAMTRDFWLRTMKCASESSAQRFIRNFDEYTDAVRQEAVDRDVGRIRSVPEYLKLRRGTIGVHPSFDYYLLRDDLPDECVNHPDVQRLASAAVDMTILANDVYSYNKEQSKGEDSHNLVAVVMKEHDLTVQEAMNYIGDLYNHIRKQYCEDFQDLPRFNDNVDGLVREFCYGTGIWVTTNIKWSFASERYFGKEGMEIMKHRTVTLLPKVDKLFK